MQCQEFRPASAAPANFPRRIKPGYGPHGLPQSRIPVSRSSYAFLIAIMGLVASSFLAFFNGFFFAFLVAMQSLLCQVVT